MSRSALLLGIWILIPAAAMAAEIRLENGLDGSNELTLHMGASGEINVIFDLAPSDSIWPNFLNGLLDAQGLVADTPITDVIEGDVPWSCDAIEPPILLEEIGMFCETGDIIPEILPMRVLTLVVTNTGEVVGDITVDWEVGAPGPQVFGPPPSYAPYVVAPCNLPPGFSNVLYVGDENSCNTPFVIHLEAPNCDGDANGDNVVDPLDAGYVLSRLGCSVETGDNACNAADVNSDGVVDPLDFGYVLSRFGDCG